MMFEKKHNKYYINYLGGSISDKTINFEVLFYRIIDFIIEFNNSTLQNNIFGDANYIHIKGGASVKYHLSKKDINTQNLTSDIDILMILSEESEKQEFLSDFINKLINKFPDYSINLIEEKGLLTVTFNNLKLIDITFSSDPIDMSDDSSMFVHSLKKLSTSPQDYYISVLFSENIEEITFTSPNFELFSNQKGLEVYNNHLNSIPKWEYNLNFFIQKYENLKLENPDSPQLIEINGIINSYKRQLKPSYIKNLRNKYNRYQTKVNLLKQIPHLKSLIKD